ncbi:2-keto-4-pentenoate hydratase [Caulobacter hibisci]|uniref:Fumarylacetoacetate hydrolase family protein n=1 Tax=Caulobacter hibisci TaxID=2035993 RepID=A0ABS0SWY4_9CAUL|nr:fumarylacetoacetate hydrolase family protein [Caulobacter hibisci]MBI1684109.1 fumarylacetoacetate hydrolase family protein [Caulobacter hibisci]
MTTDLTSIVDEVADALFEARATGRAIDPVRKRLPSKDIQAAYAVQQRNVARQQAAGAKVVGRKIGLTSKAVQTQLGVDQPDFGVLFDFMGVYGDEVELPLTGLISPRIEAEIAFVLGQDITQAGLSRERLEAAIASVAASAEIVDSAIAGWDIDIVDTVADNASSGAFVLGSPEPYVPGCDLRSPTMRLIRGGEIVSSGVGAASLGDPLIALAWLADTAVALGAPLRAGDVILAGALGPMIPLQPGLHTVEIDGFAPVVIKAIAA